MNIPNAPYYAWYIYVKFSDHAELPPELCAQSNTVGEKVFTGREITPQIIELLVSQVNMGMVVQLYISPFMENPLVYIYGFCHSVPSVKIIFCTTYL